MIVASPVLRALTEQELQDQDSWNERRMYSPLDNEALSRYFTHISKLSESEKARVVAIFDEATKADYRPKLCVTLALEAPSR